MHNIYKHTWSKALKQPNKHEKHLNTTLKFWTNASSSEPAPLCSGISISPTFQLASWQSVAVVENRTTNCMATSKMSRCTITLDGWTARDGVKAAVVVVVVGYFIPTPPKLGNSHRKLFMHHLHHHLSDWAFKIIGPKNQQQWRKNIGRRSNITMKHSVTHGDNYSR